MVAAACLAATGAQAQDLSSKERAAIGILVDEIDTEGAPGFAIGIVRGGEIVLEEYRGLADISHSTPIGQGTRFNIASNAKQYTALMALSLAQAGQIDLDSDFRNYLPGALPLVDTPITVRQLIEHRSGIRDVYDLWSLSGIEWYERALTNEDALTLLARQEELNFAPGSRHLYSNSNYILLAELVAAVTDEQFADHAKRFFARYDMTSTGWRKDYGRVVPQKARAYYRFDDWFENPDLANLTGDGFLWTTLRDQMAFEAMVQRGGDRLLQAAQARPATGSYGFGLEHDTDRGVQRVSHLGSTGAYNAVMLRYPNKDLSILVMGNNATIGVVPLGYRVAEMLLGGDFGSRPDYPARPDSIAPRPANRDVVGRYEQEGGSIITIAERGGRLYRDLAGRDPVELVHEEGALFAYSSNPDLKIHLEGKRFQVFLPSQPVATFERLAPVPLDEAWLQSVEGAYINGETGAILRIERIGGTDYRVTDMRGVGEAQMVAEDDLFWNGTRLRFERNADGKVTKLHYASGRTARISFSPMIEEHR